MTAECFSKISDGPNVLKFGLAENDEIRYLRGLAEPVVEGPEGDVEEEEPIRGGVAEADAEAEAKGGEYPT